MTPAAWRELIESYVSGRLSADSFKRRFLEAFEASPLVPRAIQEFYFVVEAYGGDPMGRGHDVADDADLMLAARRTLLHLAPAEAEPTYESEAPPSDGGAAGRVLRPPPAFAVGVGVGCAIILGWIAIGVLQLFAIAEQVDRVTDAGPVLSTLAALMLTFIPVVGSVVAFFGAMDGWGWPMAAAAAVFLAVPAIVQTGSLIAWLRRRRGA